MFMVVGQIKIVAQLAQIGFVFLNNLQKQLAFK